MKPYLKKLVNKGSEHFFYVGATLITAVVHFLFSVYTKAHIVPLEYGIYSTCLLVRTYFSYAQLGTLNAFNRDYPQLIGAGDKERAKLYRDTTFTYLIYTFLTLSIVIAIVVLIVGNTNGVDSRYIFGLIFCAFITAANVIESFLCSRVRIDGDFKYTSIVIIIELTATAIGFVLIPLIGYYALYIVLILGSVIGIIMYYKRGISDIQMTIDKMVLKSIILSGVPLLINNLIWSVVDSIDKFVILGFMDAERLGVYSIAQMAFSYMILIPTAMSQLFYVNLGKVYGASGDKEHLNKVAINYTLIISVVMSFLVLVAYFFMEPLVAMIMPKYIEGVKSAQILMLALAIYTPTMVNGNILTILKKNAALLRNAIYLCVLNAVCSVGFVIIRGVNIESVALGTAVSYLFRTVILIIQLKRQAGADVIEMIKASIVPVLIIGGPGILLYYLEISIWLRFLLAILIALFLTLVLYRKRILEIFR